MVVDDYIFRFVYIEAMRDATQQGAYLGKRKWLCENLSLSDTDHSRNKAFTELKKHTDKILNGFYIDKSQDEYDNDFCNLVQEICNSINQDNNEMNSHSFKFGNAQKLINMTVKHFYICTYSNYEGKEKFSRCHCPMDGVLLKKVYSADKEKLLKEKGYTQNTFVEESWGKMEMEGNILPKRYQDFQSCVRNLLVGKTNSIDFDYSEWEPNDNT